MDNQISDYSFLKELKQLKVLNLIGNQISDYSFLKELKQLKELKLGRNQISDISFLKDLKQLQSLNLYNNQIIDISFLKELKQLKELDLRCNSIKELPTWITELEMNIKWYDDSSYSSREGIYFYDNPLINPPIEIVKQGKEAIKNYFLSLENK